jgi:hypothetical protein
MVASPRRGTTATGVTDTSSNKVLLGTFFSIQPCAWPSYHVKDGIQHDAFKKGNDALERHHR